MSQTQLDPLRLRNYKLVVGLGNPGLAYFNTRHNIGFKVLDSFDIKFQKRFGGYFCKRKETNHEFLYLKPQTYMNLSGNSVALVVDFYKIDLEKIMIIHDEIELPFGLVKIKHGGGHAGHNGIRDIIRAIGPNFSRIRIGIGKPPPSSKLAISDYVLSKFSKQEEVHIPKILQKTIDIIQQFDSN